MRWLVALALATASTIAHASGGTAEAAEAAMRFVRSHQRCNEKEFLAPWTKEPNWKKRGSFFTVLTPFAKLCLLVRNESMGGQMPPVAEVTQLAAELRREGITVVARFPTITRKDQWGGWRHDEYQASLTLSDGKKSLSLKSWTSSKKRDLSFRTNSWDQRYWRDFATKEYQFAVPMVKLPPRIILTFRVGEVQLPAWGVPAVGKLRSENTRGVRSGCAALSRLQDGHARDGSLLACRGVACP